MRWLKWIALIVAAVIVGVVFVITGAILALLAGLAVGFDIFGSRRWLVQRAGLLRTASAPLLGIGAFLIVGGVWWSLARATGILSVSGPSPTPTIATLAHALPTASPIAPTPTALPPTATPIPPSATPNPPTPTVIIPTATPVPPTSTPLPPTATSIPSTPTLAASPRAAMSGIGRTRHDIQSIYEKPEIGFVFKEGAPVRGQPQVLGTSKNGLAMLQIIGPEDNIYEVSMLIGVPNDNPSVVAQNAVYLLGLVKVAAPDWDGGVQWVTDNLEIAIQEGEATTTHGGLKFTLQAIKELGMVGLFIEGTAE